MALTEAVAWLLENIGMETVAVSTISITIMGLAILSHITSAGFYASRGASYLKISLFLILALLLLGLLDLNQLQIYLKAIQNFDWSEIFQIAIRGGAGA